MGLLSNVMDPTAKVHLTVTSYPVIFPNFYHSKDLPDAIPGFPVAILAAGKPGIPNLSALVPLKQGDGFNMGGVGEHVHHTGTHQPIAVAHHNTSIPGQRCRVAGNIHNPIGTERGQIFADVFRTGPGRINQDLVETLFRPALARSEEHTSEL